MLRRLGLATREIARFSKLSASAVAAVCVALLSSIQPGASQTRPADELIIVAPANIVTLNPPRAGTVATDLGVISNLYSALVHRGADLQIKPSAAASWEQPDETTWRFKLVPNVKFPNGELLDANTVKWNIENRLDEKTQARLRPLLLPVIDKVTVVDATTVEIKTKQPYLPLLQVLAHLFMLPPQWTSQHDLSREALGTGPYELKQFIPGDRIVLEARADYFGEKPSFRRVVYRIMPEVSSRVAAFMAGEVDLIVDVPFTDVDRINASKVGTASTISTSRMAFVQLNTLIPPFKDNASLRQALNYAIDKTLILNSLWGGKVAPSGCQAIAKSNIGYHPDLKPYEYSPQKAKELLAKAGYPQGLTINLEVPAGRYLNGEEITQIIAAQLEEIGVKVQIKQVDFAGWINRYIGKTMDMASYLSLAGLTLDADYLLTSVSTGSFGYWKDDAFEALISKARVTADATQRLGLYRQAAERMCDQAPFIFLFEQPYVYAASNRIQWQARPDEWMYLLDFKRK